MTDARRIAVTACVMLVLLRLAIGWQLLYEGLWKINTLKTPTPWSASGYLRNAQGPLRGFFRNLAGDANDFDWLNVKQTSAKWDDWHQRFAQHYGLSDGQKARLNGWVNGSDAFRQPVPAIPEGYNNTEFEFAATANQTELSGNDAQQQALAYTPGKVRIRVNNRGLKSSQYTAEDGQTITLNLGDKPLQAGDKVQVSAGGRLMELGLDQIVRYETRTDDKTKAEVAEIVVDGRRHMLPAEREKLIADAEEQGLGDELIAAIRAVFKRAKDGISFKEKLAATLNGNPDWVSSEKHQRVGEIQKYKLMLTAYEEDLSTADQDFRHDHLQHTWGKIQTKRSELIGPVKALDKELKDKAAALLSVKQLSRGPVGEPWTQLRISDLLTMTGLTVLGVMLICGLGTRLAAILAAVMLFMFYAAMPPWPGVPPAPGPEHAFIVNKLFVEIIALLGIAALPSGRWFGLDGLVAGWFANRRAKKAARPAASAT